MSESEIINVYHEGIQAVATLVQGLSTQISDLSQTVEKQNNVISDLDARLKKLEKQSNKTSENSSLPPSTDGFKKTKSLRKSSTKKPGGQVGHKGSTLKQVDKPDVIIEHAPHTCQGCGTCLENVEAQEKRVRRQVFDLNTLKLQVTEHQSLIKVCPHCGFKNTGAFPKHVTQPTQYGPHLASVLSYFNHYQLIPYDRKMCSVLK